MNPRTDPVIHVVQTGGEQPPIPGQDQGVPDTDSGPYDGGLQPITDAGNDEMDAGLRLSHDMRRDAAPPECGEGLRYDPACGVEGDCVPMMRPPCARFCPDVPEGEFIPVECNNGLASTACADGRTCARISLEDPSAYACIENDSVPYPACMNDGQCRPGFGCHEGICLKLCPIVPGSNGEASSDASGCDCTIGQENNSWGGLWFFLIAFFWRRPRRRRTSHP